MNEFELEQEQQRVDVAAYLRTLAEGLEAGDKVTLIVGDESVTVNPPETMYFRLETSTDSTWLGGESGQSLEIELGWAADDVEHDDELMIVQQPNPRAADRMSRSTDDPTRTTSVDEEAGHRPPS